MRKRKENKREKEAYFEDNSIRTKKSKHSKKKNHKILHRVLLTILVIIIVVFLIFSYLIKKNGGGIGGVITTVIGGKKDQELQDLYTLVIGESQNMTDTIMIVKYSPRNQSMSLLSIPRDTYVGTNKENASASDKINSKYLQGPEVLLTYVNQLTGLNVKYYLTVSTKALRDLVDTVGGIDYDIPIKMDYDDPTQDLHIHLVPGMQHINGEQAEGLVRFRHNNNGTSYSSEYGDNDIGRMKTQRSFIKEVMKQTLQFGNITKVNDIIKIAQKEIETNIEWNFIKQYLGSISRFNLENMKTSQLPGTPQYINKLSFYLPSETNSKDIINELFLTIEDNTKEENSIDNNTISNENYINSTNSIVNTEITTSKKITTSKQSNNLKIDIINGSGNSTKSTKLTKQLQSLGYKVITSGDTNVINKTVIINRTSESEDAANSIQALIGVGEVTKSEDTTASSDFTIIIGQDY